MLKLFLDLEGDEDWEVDMDTIRVAAWLAYHLRSNFYSSHSRTSNIYHNGTHQIPH